VQAAADPGVSSPGSPSDPLHRRSTGIREGSLGILYFGRRLTVLHQVQVHVGTSSARSSPAPSLAGSILTGRTKSILRFTSVGNADQPRWY
jgi:hypothetical protein